MHENLEKFEKNPKDQYTTNEYINILIDMQKSSQSFGKPSYYFCKSNQSFNEENIQCDLLKPVTTYLGRNNG